MKYLAYCILRDHNLLREAIPKGLEGNPVSLVSEGRLAAAFSAVTEAWAGAHVGLVLAYARVVEAFHALGTVLPLRYGCLLATEADLVKLLGTRGAEFHAALDELEGCVEMGIRLLLPPADQLLGQWGKRDRKILSGCGDPGQPQAACQGAAYLASRRACCSARASQREKAAVVTEQIRRTFAGLFVKSKVEQTGTGGGGLFSLQFLVRREHCNPFRQAFCRLQTSCPEKVMLTGPWPPYNFVVNEKVVPLR